VRSNVSSPGARSCNWTSMASPLAAAASTARHSSNHARGHGNTAIHPHRPIGPRTATYRLLPPPSVLRTAYQGS
jgi:hypothetical protein